MNETTGHRAIDFVTRGYLNKRKRIEVPEWIDDDGDPLEIYFGVFTSDDADSGEAEMRQLYGPNRAEWPDHELRIRQVVAKAEYEDGSPVFNQGDVHALKTKCPMWIINRLYAQMVAVAVRREEIEGKSGTTGRSDRSTTS